MRRVVIIGCVVVVGSFVYWRARRAKYAELLRLTNVSQTCSMRACNPPGLLLHIKNKPSFCAQMLG